MSAHSTSSSSAEDEASEPPTRLAKAQHRVRTDDVWSDAESFAELGISERVLRGLSAAGYLRPSPVQRAVIPRGRLGGDLIVQAKSGTGKTVVFAVIALEAVRPSKTRVQALLLAPTRELAVQTAAVVTAVGRYLEGVACIALIGGLPAGDQERRLRQGPGQVVVGTPGRTRALLEAGSLGFSLVRLVVLDEADRLLTAPSLEGDTREILGCLPEDIQVVAVSATYAPGVLHDLEGLMRDPERLDLTGGLGVSLRGVRQYFVLIDQDALENPDDTLARKADAAVRLLNSLRGLSQAVVFCNDQHGAQWLADRLTAAGFPSAFLSGALDQRDRLRVMGDVRALRVRAVVATDLVARGVDLDLVNLVLNVDVPPEPATLMHRVGRTGRFGTLGLAVSLLTAPELAQLRAHLAEVRGGEVAPLPAEVPEDWYALELDDTGEQEALARLSVAPVSEAPAMAPRPLRARYRAKGEPRHGGAGEEGEDEGEGAHAEPGCEDEDRARPGETSSRDASPTDPLTLQRRGYYAPYPSPRQPWLPAPGPQPPYPQRSTHRFPYPRPHPVHYYQAYQYGQHPYYAPYGPVPSQRVWPGSGPASAPLGPENQPPQRPPDGPPSGAHPPPWAVPPHRQGQHGTHMMRQALPPPSAAHTYGHLGYRAPYGYRYPPQGPYPYAFLAPPGPYANAANKYYHGVRPSALSSHPPFNGPGAARARAGPAGGVDVGVGGAGPD